MQRCLLILLMTCMFVACKNVATSDILPKEKMEKVLWDIAQGSEFLNGYVYFRYPALNRTAINMAMLDRIFKIHNITKEQFSKSLKYYRENPKELAIVLDSVVIKQKRLSGDTLSPPNNSLLGSDRISR